MLLLDHNRAGYSFSLVVALLLSGCGGNGPKDGAVQAQMNLAAPVTVATVTEKTVPVEIHVIGNGEAFSTVQVKSQVDGQLQTVHFREGEDVQKGELLFNIDPRPFDAALHQARANLAKDVAQAKNARAQADRNTQLLREGIVSKDQYEQIRTNAEALEAGVKADQAAVENAEVQLGYCSIYSPLAGRTGNLMVYEGNLVKANDAALVVINQISPLYVEFSAPEQYLPEIKKFQAQGGLKVEATVPQDEAQPQEGVLSFINNSVDTATGTILLKATFPNPEKRMWPGQFVNVVVRLTSERDALVVPSQAVQTGQSGQYVYLMKPDMTVDLRPVTTGIAYRGYTVIAKGLALGDKVVADGQLALYPRAKVEVKGEVK